MAALATLKRWSGPALAGFGLLAVSAIALQPAADRGLVAWWILKSALAPMQVLPLIGLGVALTLAGRCWCTGAAALFAGGLAVGFLCQEGLLGLLASLPGSKNSLFFAGPIACLAAGLALAPTARIRSWLLPCAAFLVGVTLALAIVLTDPNLDDPSVLPLGVLVGAWIVCAVALTGRAFPHRWFPAGGRILGSWLIAIGLLYGAASLARKPASAPQPAPGASGRPAARDFEKLFPGLDRPPPPAGRGQTPP